MVLAKKDHPSLQQFFAIDIVPSENIDNKINKMKQM